VKEKKVIALSLLPVIGLAALLLWPEVPDPSLVMREAADRPNHLVPEKAVVKRQRHVQLNPSAIEAVREGGRVIEFELFPGETIRVLLEPAEQTGLQSSEVHGLVEGVPGSVVTLVTYDGALAGTVQYPDGRTFMVNYAGANEHSIVELDPDKMETPPGVEQHFNAQPPLKSLDGTVFASPQLQFGVTNRVPGFTQFTHTLNNTNPWPTQVLLGPINYGPPIVGVMVVYTPGAKKECAGPRGIESRIRLSVAQVNAAFKRSLITAKLVLLHTAEVDYESTGHLYTDLINITYGRTAPLLDIHKLRQEVRADLVSLFVRRSPHIFHGISWMLNSSRPAPAYGFNVMDAVYAPTSVFAHEIGHNLGCSHATNDPGGFIKGRFTNSHGWRFSVTNRGNTYPMRTIMAYGAGPRLGYYSNPRVSIWGSPAGNAAFADNANTISNTAPMVGSYMTEIIHTAKLVPNATSVPLLPGAATRFGIRQPRRTFRIFLSGN